MNCSVMWCSRVVLGYWHFTGNALAWVQRVRESVELWDITFCICRSWGFYYIPKVSRSWIKIVEPQLLPKIESVLLSWQIGNTWNQNSSFMYFQVVRIAKQIHLFLFWEKLRLNNFVSRSTDLYWNLQILTPLSSREQTAPTDPNP